MEDIKHWNRDPSYSFPPGTSQHPSQAPPAYCSTIRILFCESSERPGLGLLYSSPSVHWITQSLSYHFCIKLAQDEISQDSSVARPTILPSLNLRISTNRSWRAGATFRDTRDQVTVARCKDRRARRQSCLGALRLEPVSNHHFLASE